MNANYINPFIIASTKILKDMCFIDASIGKPYVNNASFADDMITIIIGVTGQVRGQALLTFKNDVACDIASKMIMTEVMEIDGLAMSALCELGNMILGNTATVFSTKGIGIDITPPTVEKGNVTSAGGEKNICIPLIYDEYKKLELSVSIH